MFCRTGVDVNDGFGILIASCREYSLGLIEILKSNFGYKMLQRSYQFVMSKSSVIMKFMVSRFKFPLHLETTPLFGWSYPEARIATWMSYDTETGKNPEEVDYECMLDTDP